MNEPFAPYFDTKKRYAVLVGGRGSGKSYSAADKHILRVANVPGHKIGICRKVHRTTLHSTFATVVTRLHDLGLAHLFDVFRGERSIRRRDGGGEFVFFGLDDAEKVKSLQGITSLWIEEATEFSERDIIDLNMIMRTPAPDGYQQMTLTFNPLDEAHWLYRRFFESTPPANAYVLVTTHNDNAFLHPDVRDEIEALREQNYNLWRVYARGEWGRLEGQIYAPFEQHDTPPEGTPYDTVYGLDFGYVNATALVRVDWYDEYGPTAPWVSEVIYESGMTNSDLIKRLDTIPALNRYMIYADGAEMQRIEEIQRAGYRIQPADKSAGSVAAGIGHIQSLTVHTPSDSTYLNRERSAYLWQEDAHGNALDKPVKYNDHAMDAMRYAIYTHYMRGAGRAADFTQLGDRRNTADLLGERSVLAEMESWQ